MIGDDRSMHLIHALASHMSAQRPSRSGCLTSVVTEEGRVEVAQLQSILHRIQELLAHVPAHEREYIADALLRQALRKAGTART